MNRRGFLKFLGVGAAVAVATPHLSVPSFFEKVGPSPELIETFACDQASMLSCLKEFYGGVKMRDLVYEQNPFFKLVKQEPPIGGNYPIPVLYGKE